MLLDAAGAAVPESKPENRWEGLIEPKGSSPYFGWIDAIGDPVTIRLELVAALARNARTGRFVIILAQAGMAPDIGEDDAYRLMRRLGWSLKDGKKA